MNDRLRYTAAALFAGLSCTTLLAASTGNTGVGLPDDPPAPSDPPPLLDGWARYDDACPSSDSTVIVECGDLGDFHLGSVVAPVGCSALASGTAPLPVYPPTLAPAFGISPIFYAIGGGGAPSTDAPTSTAATFDRRSAETPIATHGPESPWIGAVDFNDSHGWSTTYTAGRLAGGAAPAKLVVLDDVRMQPLGEGVTDFNVLGALCRIVEDVHDGGAPAPRVLNMSFGRVLDAAEAEQIGDICDPERFVCQLLELFDALRTTGATLVAAAGNHDELLFPAVAEQTISVGRLDWLDPDGGSLWDSPDAAQARVPGSQLCLTANYAAPGGSSYSSAVLSGYLADLLNEQPQLDPHSDPEWRVRWSAELSCWAIARPGETPHGCNPALQSLLDGLDGANADSCWPGPRTVSVEAPLAIGPARRPHVPSYDHWSTEVRPTPTGDPCVPCEAEVVEEPDGEVLEVNASHSQPLDEGVHLLAVYLRTKFGFDQVEIDADALRQLRDGELDLLRISGHHWPTPLYEQPSLWYLISDRPLARCDQGDRCYWDASSILVRNR